MKGVRMEIQTPCIVVPTQSKFPLGRLVITSAALETLPIDDVENAVRKHASGDWGELEDEDQAANEQALVTGLRLFSVYRTACGIRFYIITEWDSSVHTILLPS